TRRVEGPSLTVDVGNGSELYGSCTPPLTPARLADGYLPILETSYVDAQGVRDRHESFVRRRRGTLRARSVISFIRLTVDARHARANATVRLVPSQRLVRTGPDRMSVGRRARLIVSRGARLTNGVATYRARPGTRRTLYAEWLHAPSRARALH